MNGFAASDPRRRRSARYGSERARFDHGEPIRRLPFAPFVVLAGLAPLLLAIAPPRTHALTIALFPQVLAGDRDHDRISVVGASDIRSNADRVTLPQLDERLLARERMRLLVLVSDGSVSYGVTAQILHRIAVSGNAGARFCLGGLAEHRTFAAPWRNTPMYLIVRMDPHESIVPPVSIVCDPLETGRKRASSG